MILFQLQLFPWKCIMEYIFITSLFKVCLVNEVLHLHPGCTPRIFKFSSTVCFELVFQVLYFTSARLKTQAALEVAQMLVVKDLQSVLGSAFGNNRIICEGSGLI